jgi:phosphoribosylglycinamide formyltransferase-1
LVSGGGTNLQSLIDAQNTGTVRSGKIGLVISSKPDAYAVSRAKKHGIPVKTIDKKALGMQEFTGRLLEILREENPDLIVLAGFLVVLSEEVTSAYPNKIINVHPSLLPKFSGKGYYGLKVHQAVIESGEKVTGATVHYVNEVCDGGAVILQKEVPVLNGDTAEILQKRVMEQAEQVILPEAVEKLTSEN